MDFKTPGALNDLSLHPLWPAVGGPPRPKRPQKPRWVVAPIPVPVAGHIEGQRQLILLLANMLARILDALDHDQPQRAATIARETLEELGRALTLH
jgi:hypothetical protein